MADTDITKMKVADLKRELKIRGQSVTGNKNELVERLQAAIIEGDVFDETGISEDLLDEGDDVLNDDELEEESLLNASEDAILKSPLGSTRSKSPNPSVAVNAQQQQQQQQQPPKKVVLKRKLITTISVDEDDKNKSESASTDAPPEKCVKTDENNSTDGDDDDDKKTIKFSELSMKERLELRAKKFGAAPSGDALKLARAERFGISADAKTTSKSSDGSDTGKIVAAPVSVDVLKKRAERFGGSVSTVMNQIENKEKLLKRQERFGSGSSSSATSANATEAAGEYAEKAKQRLERFKTTVK